MTGPDPIDVLRRYWGYDSFRPLQLDIIRSVAEGRDTLGLMPTGGGKSITFQVPALMTEGVTLVVTPLISLMKDQVDNLRERNIRAIYVHSGLSRRELRLAMDRCRLGKVKILYLSPEKLSSPTFIAQLREMDVRLIVVDEAHCISQWGYDFRPSYLKIAEVRKLFPQAPVLALTASATPEVVDDIKRQLQFRPESRTFRMSFARPNISYVVRLCRDKEGKLLQVVQSVEGTAIVYVRSRKRSREVADFLLRGGISADFYHAGLAPEEKTQRQERWKAGQTRVMVATTAFGMGIDKPDVRLVAHFDPPSSLEEYYQEAGRAGRDGLPSFAVMIATPNDKGVLTRRLADAFPDKEFVRDVYDKMCVYLNVPMGEGFQQAFEINPAMFCQRFSLPPAPTVSALKLLTQAGHIEFTEEISTQSRLMMLVTREALYHQPLVPETERVLQCVLRSYTGIFADYEHINEQTIASSLNLTPETVYQALLRLTNMHIIHYVPRRTSPFVQLLHSREPKKEILIPIAVYEERQERMRRRIEAMKNFIFDPSTCRANQILAYFGETPDGSCGSCDVCRTAKGAPTADERRKALADNIMRYFAAVDSAEVADLARWTGRSVDDVIAAVRSLADDQRLRIEATRAIKI